MKKFIQVSMCIALLGSTVIKANGTFDKATDAAQGATFAAAGAFLATEHGRTSLKRMLLNDSTGNINTKHVGIAVAAGAAVGAMENYGLHNYLRKLPAVGDTAADFVEDHKYGVAMGAVVVALWLCNQFLKAAESAT